MPVADPMLLSALVRRLDGAGIAVDELALRLPSLDEVFLALTGQPAEEPSRRPREGTWHDHHHHRPRVIAGPQPPSAPARQAVRHGLALAGRGIIKIGQDSGSS